MDDAADNELSQRLRANRGRLLRPEFTARIERAFGFLPDEEDFLDPAETNRLEKELLAHLRDLQPERTWPESERPSVFDHLRELAGPLGEHSSYLAFFVDWESIGALRVQSGVVLSSTEDFWEQSSEPVCLVTGDLRDGLFLDHEDPDHLAGGDEYELYAWGAFAR